ncbi:MAG: mannitol dehydrogenase [Christensenellaceae bacterium]|nr:mannitol dehydrogenase [Christensenellaceae bacterium]
MKAVMYGAGNIGRGFIGYLFSKSGYEVTFIDVAEPVVHALNRGRAYPVRVVSSEGYEEEIVSEVKAVNGRDENAAAEAIAEADVMATAVGVNVMGFIAPVIAKGLKLRRARARAPLNIIICENLIDANHVLSRLIKEHLDMAERAWFDENVGLMEASIGRMVPVQTPEMQDGNPLRVCVERYGFLPVDAAGCRGEMPRIANMVPFAPFDFYIRRKLYLHNCGHAIAAYLGLLQGRNYIYEVAENADARLICQSAMTESAIALAKAYGVDPAPLLDHAFDLLVRFENRALMDTCARVGADTVRKLGASDRLIGAARLCLEQGVTPAFIALGAAAALMGHLDAAGQPQSPGNARAALEAVSGVGADDPLAALILPLYELAAGGADLGALRRAADRARVAARGPIV